MANTVKSRLASWAARAPVTAFLAGSFLWAWLLWGYWIPAMPPGGLEMSPIFLVSAILGGFAPSLVAIAVAWTLAGRAGIAQLLAPLVRWRIHPGWYAVALLTAPAVTLIIVAIQAMVIGGNRFSGIGVPIPILLIWPLMAGLGEEIGWRGFLLPRLQPRLGVLPAALVIGAIWGLWHLPADYIALKAYGDWFIPAFLVNGPIVLTAHAIIMSWLWNRTGGNLLLIVLYHFTITASAMVVPSGFTDGARGVLAAAIGAGCFWIVAVGLVTWRGSDFTLVESAPPANSSA
ncbi:type II CAAX endopeptidase family protein [Devosia sp. SL43]|uniref:type II CAAX endopeptidase family protein n=1 Tax=Devosia sp. SL43 TaxID=2806348 RepID=UPI001F1ED5E5|nr:type II CAAX endopeptidase family protein [Devosia sp. SL43]UJW85014.1 CPBP family intramembrane metalloprotease [Devosia sp. SL43]